MTLDQLRYFQEAARYQHVGKAALAARISPSAVSGAVRALEEELGCALFERRGKAVFLTAAGRRLQTAAARLLAQAGALREAVHGQPAGLAGEYRLGASHFLASRVL